MLVLHKNCTGDTPGTAKEIGLKLVFGVLRTQINNIITGPEFEELPDETTTRPYRGFEDYSSCPFLWTKNGW